MMHKGSCHCGQVRYQVSLDPSKANRCNCSICTKLGTTNGIVKPDAFELLEGESSLATYGKFVQRFFCKHCGVHCFGKGHLEEVGGDFVSVNLNTLDDIDPNLLTVGYWDGRHDNWQAGTRPEPWPIFAPALTDG